MTKSFFLLLTIMLLTSCATKKEVVLFQNAESLEGSSTQKPFQPIIEINDILRVNVSSMDQEVVEPFQLNIRGGSSGSGSSGSSGNSALTGYLVDVDGNIQFPVLGEVKVTGKTREEVAELLQSKVRQYVKDAVVSVRILNFKVTVLGEEGGSSNVQVTDGRMTMPQLLADVGGINGKRDNILIIRESNGVRSVGRVDMTDVSVFNSPYFYLKQNDIVYVEPTYKQVKTIGLIGNYGALISVGTSILSLILLLTR